MNNSSKKVLLLQGTPMEIGQSLTNLYAENPKFSIVEQFTSQSAREIKQKIVTAAGPQYEAILVIIMIYENPGELKGAEFQPPASIKGQLKN
jgi:hypothetical protein